jgi:hypothetical protein
MIECETCTREFVNWHAAQQHMNAIGHWACETCDGEFWTEQDAEMHMDYYDHRRPRFECEACTATYDTQHEARIHMEANNHWRVHWCASCQKGFQNENNLKIVSLD